MVESNDFHRLVGRPPRISISDIISHPQLPAARAVYLEAFVKVYDGDPFVVRLLIESGRFLVYYIILMLESGYDPSRRETWPTIGLLKKTVAVFGAGRASERHVDHLIARLCAVGCLELRVCDQDRRVRLLSTGELLRRHDREWLAANYAPIAMLYPDHDYSPILWRDPEFQRHYRRASLPYMALGAALMSDIPDIMMFFDHAAGPVIVAALLHAAMTQGDPCAAISYADIGDRFGVSRTHVRGLLVAAEKRGLVTLIGRGGKSVEVLPRMWAAHDDGMARGIYFHDILYLAATSSVQAAPSQG